MNKTTTRLLIWSFLCLSYFEGIAQRISGITTETSGLVCPGGIARIDKDTTAKYPYTYEYWDGESWVCCFGGNQTPYDISLPATGQWIEVQRKYTNGVAVVKRESVGFFYTPVAPQIAADPFPGTCNTNTGRIVVTDRSRNFDKMPRRFKLYDQNNVLRGNFLVDTSIYNFVNLPAGTYRVIVETPCNSVYSEKTDIIVTTSSQNPVLDIAFSGHDDCLTNNVNASVVLPENIPTAGVQYRMDGGDWQASNTFTNVTPWLIHQFSARLSGCFEASTTQFVSELSIPRIQSLERAKDTDCTPANNEIRVFVPEGSDAQIQFNHSGGWYNPGQWIGPLPDGTLHIRARSAYLPSCYRDTLITLSEHGSVSLIGADASNLNDCTLGNIGLQLRTEPAVSTGLEYFVEGKGWQSSAQFSGLSNGDKRIAIRSTGLCQVGVAADTVTLSEIIAPQIESIAPQGHDDCVVGNAGFWVYLVQSVSGVKFRINGGAWQPGNLFQNLPAGNYLVEAARADGTCVSSQNYALVETGSVSITGLSKANENDCVVGNAQFQVLHTGGSQQGLKFRLNGGAWQDSAIFRNLTRMAVNVEAQIQKPSCTSSIVAWPDSIREQSNFPEIASVSITNDKDCTAGNARVAFTLKVPMTATYWLSSTKNNTTGVFTGLSSGTYTFQVYKTANGCVQPRVVTIDEKLNFTLDSLRVQGGDDCLNNNAVVTIYHPYGNNYGLQFREVSRNTPWQNSNAFPLNTHGVGQYNLEARNANGCTLWSGSIYGQERLNPEITGVVGIDGLSDCSLGNVTAQVQLLNASAGTAKQYRLNGGAWNLSSTLPGFRHGSSNLVELTYNFGGIGTKQCTISKSIVIDEKAKEITGVLLDAATLSDCSLNNVKATIQVDGSTSNLRYVVTGKTEGTSNIFTNLNNGQYKAIIRDVVSTCRDTMLFTIAETPALALPAPIVQNVVCYGAATGSISVSPTGGMAPYTYLWSTGATSANITGLTAGTYSVAVSDNRGCSLSQTVQVTGPAQSNLPQISFSGDTSICKGASFSVSASAVGTYSWNTGATSSTISGSPENTTTYTVTVTNGLGCSASASRIITVNALPVPNIEGINTICAGQSTTLTATGGSTYAWQHGATGASITASPASTTTYKVTVTNAAGCSAIYNRTVRVNTLPSVQIAGLPSGPLCGTGSVVLTAISTTATSYRWSTNETSPTISAVLNVSAGFGVTVKDINGCEASTGATVSVIPRPVAQILGGDIPCRGNSTVLTAIGGASYLWSNNATTSSISINQPTQNQTYSVTVSNGPGCNSVDYKTVMVPAAFTLRYSLEKDQDCTPNNTQIVPVPHHAQGAVTYLLTPLNTFDFSTSLSDLGTGQYTLSAIDGKGCMADTTVVINEAPVFRVQILDLQNQNDCIAGNVQLKLGTQNGRGPVEIRLNPNGNPDTLFSLASGTYKAVAVDSLGCRDSLEVVVDERLPYYLRAYQRNTEDCNPNNTAIAVYGQSARGALSFQLDDGVAQTDSLFSNVAPGAHRLYFIDSLGCRDSFYLLVANEAQLQADVQGVSRCDTADAVLSIYASPSSAATQYQYSVDTGQNWQNSQEFTNLPPGLYIPALKKLPVGCIITGDTLVISDTCRSYALAGFTKDTVMITEPDQLVIFPWLVETPRWMQDDFNLKLVLQGTGEPHFVEYNPDGTNSNLRSERLFAQRQYLNGFNGPDKDSTALASTARLFDYPQEYIFSLQSVTPTKLKIDPKRKDLRVIVAFDPETYTEITVIICKGESTTLDASPGSCFNWNDGSKENPRTVSPTEDTEYSVTVLDDKLQARVIRYKVIVLDVDPEITVETDPDELCEDGPIKLKASPVGAQYTYLWNTGATTAEISVSSSSLLNLYRVTVTESREDSEGNVKTCSAVAEMGKEEILAAVQSEKWNAVFDKLVELGFKPYPCRLIKAPAFRAIPELRDACVGVEDFSEVREIEWDATIVGLKQRVCDDVTAANAEGFGARGYLFDGICHPSFQQIMSDVRTDLHNMDQVIVYLDRKDSDDDVFFQYFEEYDKFIEETFLSKLENELSAKDCKETDKLATFGGSRASWRSWAVQKDYIDNVNPLAKGEFQIPYASSDGNSRGHVDIAVPAYGDIYEVKPERQDPAAKILDQNQLQRYIVKARLHCPPTLWKAGRSYPPLGRYIHHVEDPVNKVLYAYMDVLSEPGIIRYRDISRNDVHVPIPIPPFLPPIQYPENTIERLKRHYQQYVKELERLAKELGEDTRDGSKELERKITQWLRDNPKVVELLKKELQIAIATGAITIAIATIAEDIATGGLGIADDAASFALVMKLFQIAAKI